MRTTVPANASAAFWLAYDLGCLFLVTLLSSEVLGRFGLNSVLWPLVYAAVLARLIIAPAFTLGLIARNWVFLVFPAVCMFSTIWSLAPSASLVASIQLTMTVLISMLVGARFSLRTISLVYLGTAGFAALLSLVQLVTGAFGQSYAPAGGFLGVFKQKNVLGHRLTIGIAVCLAVLIAPARRYLTLERIFALGFLPIFAFLLFRSQAITSTAILFIFCAIFFVLSHRALPRSLMLSLFAVLVPLLAVAPITLVIAGINPISEFLNTFGKSATLTGRTELWRLAAIVLEDHWFAGIGYYAFWKSSAYANMAALAQAIGGDGVASFHNFIYETLVATGIFGLAAMVFMLAAATRRAVMLWWRTGDVYAALAVALILISILGALLEPRLYRQHEFSLMMVTILAVAAGRRLEEFKRMANMRSSNDRAVG